MIVTRDRWQGVVAAWGAAAVLVMRQFGTPMSSTAPPDVAIVRVEDATSLLSERERLPDGRVVTVPLDLVTRREVERHLN